MRSEGVELSLILLPDHPNYASLESEAFRKGMDALIESLGQDIPFLDLRGTVPDDLFCDHIHPFAEGSEILSGRIRDWLASLPRREP